MTYSKYKAKKTVFDGITFDSRREAQRYAVLKLLEKSGEITDLKRQVVYELIPAAPKKSGMRAERACTYKADFVYKDCRTGKTVVEDVKGVRPRDYVIKRKLMRAVYGISVQET